MMYTIYYTKVEDDNENIVSNKFQQGIDDFKTAIALIFELIDTGECSEIILENSSGRISILQDWRSV